MVEYGELCLHWGSTCFALLSSQPCLLNKLQTNERTCIIKQDGKHLDNYTRDQPLTSRGTYATTASPPQEIKGSMSLSCIDHYAIARNTDVFS